MLTAIHRLLEVLKVIGSAFSSGVLSVDLGIVDIEAKKLFVSFIDWPVMSFVVVLHY